MSEELTRRVELLEDDSREKTTILGELQTVVMGPAPSRNNGIRGDLRALTKEFGEYKEACLEEGTNVRVASINLRGVYIMGALQFLTSVLVALIAAGVFKH
jgi:hypothetical protein